MGILITFGSAVIAAAIMTVSGPLFFAERKRIVESAGKYRLAGYLLPERVCR